MSWSLQGIIASLPLHPSLTRSSSSRRPHTKQKSKPTTVAIYCLPESMAGGRHSEYTLPREGQCHNPCRVEQGPKHSEHRNIIAAHVPVEPEGPQSWHAAAWDCASIRLCCKHTAGPNSEETQSPCSQTEVLIPCFCLPQGSAVMGYVVPEPFLLTRTGSQITPFKHGSTSI